MGAQTCKVILNTSRRGFLAIFPRKFVKKSGMAIGNSLARTGIELVIKRR